MASNIENLEHMKLDDALQPWFKDPTASHPFRLVRQTLSTVGPKNTHASDFQTMSLFPWSDDSLAVLWGGKHNTDENLGEWKAMISQYWDAVAVGSSEDLRILFSRQTKEPIHIPLPKVEQELIEADKTYVQWGLSDYALSQPLAMVSRGSIVYIVNVVMLGLAGASRGHGGAITSVNVHPTRPNIFCTTSRDHSTRIYDLTEKIPELKFVTRKGKKKPRLPNPNPVWPPMMKEKSMAGASHGLRLVKEPEGSGIGRCVLVLMGGRSAGHNAAVLGAAFHPIYPIIATCGMDRYVKIWPIRNIPGSPAIKTEDKPLFSSSRIHKSSVLSVSWASEDILLTHSAPAIMRHFPYGGNKEIYLEPGELVVWRWLAVERFFPPGGWDKVPVEDQHYRGCSSDYQESTSFKLLSIHAFPEVENQYITPRLSVFQTSKHDPIMLSTYPTSTTFTMVNVSQLQPKIRPPFPLDVEALEVGSRHATPTPTSSGRTARRGRRFESDDAVEGLDNPDSEEENAENIEIDTTPVVNGREEVTFPDLEGWQVDMRDEVERFGPVDEERRLMDVAMGLDGQIIVGVGTKGSMWVWKARRT